MHDAFRGTTASGAEDSPLVASENWREAEPGILIRCSDLCGASDLLVGENEAALGREDDDNRIFASF